METGKKKQKNGITLREFSSGGVVFNISEKEPLWLIARSSPSGTYTKIVWRLPKGWIDDEGNLPGPVARGDVRATEEELQSTAVREVAEEGGVEAEIISKVGTESFVFFSDLRKERVMKFVTFYLMRWIRDLPQGYGEETSDICWLPYRAARKKLTNSGEKLILDKAYSILAESGQ